MNFRRPEQADVTAASQVGRSVGEVPCRRRPRYTLSMTNDANLLKRIALWSLGLAAFAGLTGVAFSAWLGQGSAILLTMAESGLAWCF